MLDTTNENSHAFLLPFAIRNRLGLFDVSTIKAELVELQTFIDNLALRIYGLEGTERQAVEDWAEKEPGLTVEDHEPDVGEDESAQEDSGPDAPNPADAYITLQSWALGVAFGRFDPRLATDEGQAPPEPEPFDPLPTRSPGMVPEADAAQFPARAMLVDDLGHALDLTPHVEGVLERVGFAPENRDSLRRWFARDFFPLHIKMYSKSRRKAPIYWQVATPSASYSVWLYIHAFSRDVLYKVQEVAGTKLQHEEKKLESLRADLGPNPNAAERKTSGDPGDLRRRAAYLP